MALPTTFLDKDLRSSQSDILFLVHLKDGRPGFVYAVLEHKSYSDPGTALQMWGYKLRILNKYAKGQARLLRALPTVLPLVFYHGPDPWTAPGSIREMMATRDERLLALEPAFGYYLRDLTVLPVERLASDAAARAGLIALRQSHKGGSEARMRLLPEVVAGPQNDAVFEQQVLLYLVSVWGIPVRTLEDLVEQGKPGRGKAVISQVAQELMDRGRAEGLIEGEARAEARGMARSLTQLLEHRFGPLPRAVHTRIAGASAGELSVAFTAALNASSLSEVFADFVLG